MKIERLIIYLVFFLRIRRTPRSTRTDTLSLHDALPISVVLALLVFAAWWWLRARRRRAAIVRLFDERLHAANTPVERVAAMSELLRRAARRRDPAADRLQGDAWLAFLDGDRASDRSEEHTSELQSLMRISYAVFCLKKKTHANTVNTR